MLAVSERSLLTVVVPARDGRALVQRLCEALEPLLTTIGISADEATAERGAMQYWAVGNTANRRVLGSLNDLAFQLQVGLLNFRDQTLLAQSLWLAKTPLKVIDYGAPDQATLARSPLTGRCRRPSTDVRFTLKRAATRDPKRPFRTLKTRNTTYDRRCRVSRVTYTCINVRRSRATG